MELIGIIGTLFIVLAFSLDGEKKIRTFDLIGASLFVVYGITIHSFSTILLNGILIIIQVYKLLRLRKGPENEKSS